MSFFDFSEDVQRAMLEATSDTARLSAKTKAQRAALSNAVRRAGFSFLTKDVRFLPEGNDLVVGVAAWSDPDLSALELLVGQARRKGVRVGIFDIDDLSYSDMVRIFPGMRRFIHTPVIIHYREGEPPFFAEGRDALLWLQEL